MNLYWVTTPDHEEDWFIIADTPQEAATFHEDAEGYDVGDATAEQIMEVPSGVMADPGWPTHKVLEACGARIVVDGPTRVIRIGDRTFCEGLMESEIRALDDVMREAYGEGIPDDNPREIER